MVYKKEVFREKSKILNIESKHQHSEMIEDALENEQNTNKSFGVRFAYILCLADVLFYSISYVSVQYLQGAVPENELNLFRYASSVCLSCILVCTEKTTTALWIPCSLSGYFILIAIISVLFNSALYTSAVYIPVGVVGGISTSSTMIFNAIFSICIKKERRSDVYIGSLVVLFGICLLIQPSFIFPSSKVPKKNWISPCKYINQSMAQQNMSHVYEEKLFGLDIINYKEEFGYVLAISSGFFKSSNLLLTRRVVEYISPSGFQLWKFLLTSVFSLTLMLIIEEPSIPSSPFCIICLLSHAIFVGIHGLVVPYCLQVLSASTVNIISALNLVVLLILQYTLMKNIMPGKQNWVEILGAALCFIGSIGGTIKQLFERQANV